MKPPYFSIKNGTRVVITKTVCSQNSNVPEAAVGQMFTVVSSHNEGRSHNQYIASVTIQNKSGLKYHAIIDQLASCNPNYEPDGDFIVCIACGATFHEKELRPVRGLAKEMSCPACKTIDCTTS